jgi:membrane protein DedA with SNARE-associated domain
VSLPAWIAGPFLAHGYLVTLAGIALENVGLPVPGEVLLLTAGILAASGDLSPWAVMAAGTAGAMAGDHLGYLLGRFGGHRLPALYCKATLGSADCTRRTADYFRRHAWLTIPLARFVAGVRIFAAPMAGATGMPYLRFVGFDLLGAGIWASIFTALGYFLGSQWGNAEAGYRRAFMIALLMLVIGTAGMLGVKLVRRWRFGAAHLAG